MVGCYLHKPLLVASSSTMFSDFYDFVINDGVIEGQLSLLMALCVFSVRISAKHFCHVLLPCHNTVCVTVNLAFRCDHMCWLFSIGKCLTVRGVFIGNHVTETLSSAFLACFMLTTFIVYCCCLYSANDLHFKLC